PLFVALPLGRFRALLEPLKFGLLAVLVLGILLGSLSVGPGFLLVLAGVVLPVRLPLLQRHLRDGSAQRETVRARGGPGRFGLVLLLLTGRVIRLIGRFGDRLRKQLLGRLLAGVGGGLDRAFGHA